MSSTRTACGEAQTQDLTDLPATGPFIKEIESTEATNTVANGSALKLQLAAERCKQCGPREQFRRVFRAYPGASLNSVSQMALRGNPGSTN
jgi:hypothetical protein